MKYSKKKLLEISRQVERDQKITTDELDHILSFEREDKHSPLVAFLKKSAVPVALVVGFLIVVFPKEAEAIARTLPFWTNLPAPVVRGADYIWNIIGEPVGKASILYHLPNVILYSFGVLGVKKVFDAINRKTWVDKVSAAKQSLMQRIELGTPSFQLKRGHSALFVGKGDHIANQFVLNHKSSEAVILGETKPSVTNIWNYYTSESGFSALKNVFDRVCDKDTGEFVFFPVKDDQIFLPGPQAYDLSPHRLDILCQDIRMYEKQKKWKPRRILIVGDRFHRSFVQSEDKNKKVSKSEDIISLQTISEKYPKITLVDPTDIVLRRVLKIANGRKIVFRATKEGINEYKNRFYFRLEKLGYKEVQGKKGVLTIGYDIFEDQTEQQTLSKKIDDYYPIVLSKSVRDALIRNGYREEEFMYVPGLVLEYLTKKAHEQ